MVIAELAKSVSVTIQLVWLQVEFLYLVLGCSMLPRCLPEER